jgi:hypothetical protein
MIAYMVQRLSDGKWFKRGCRATNWEEDQLKASIWLTKSGPAGVKSAYGGVTTVIEFDLIRRGSLDETNQA